MANPKLENGYTRIAHELLEAIMLSDFTAAEYKILFAVIRQTYGFQKKSAEISRAQFSRMCDLHFTSVSRAVSNLLSNKVLIEKSSPGFAKCREVAINKNYREWVAYLHTDSATERGSVRATKGGSVDATKGGSVRATHTKDIYKHNIKNRENSPSLESINDFSKENNLDLNVAEKFFKYYESREWKTNGGSDVAAVWRDKLVEWNKNEVRKSKSTRKETADSVASYDKALIEKLLNSDD